MSFKSKLKLNKKSDNKKSGKHSLSIIARVSGWVILVLYPLLCMFIMEYFNQTTLQPDKLFNEIFKVQIAEYGMQLLFGIIVLYLLLAVLLLFTKRGWIATGILGFLSLLCTYINYMKLMLKGTPFIPADISLIGQIKELASYISVSIPSFFWLCVVIMTILVILIAISKVALKIRWYYRIPVAAICVLCILFTFADYDRSTRILNLFNMDIFDNALQTSNYTANGFVGAFTLNLIGMHIEEPEDYNESSVDSILSDYDGTDKSSDTEDFDVIVVLSESFCDIRRLNGTSYSENILSNYDAIRNEANCYSGKICTIALGGGTVNTEFRVLTGLNTDNLMPSGATPYNYIDSDLEGYVSNYKNNGYNTIGLHLYNRNFYNRSSVYPYLGFDTLIDAEMADDNPDVAVSWTRGYATDESTEAAIEYYLNSASENGNPTFLFAITIENHQPYEENEANTVTVNVDNEEFASNSTWMTALTTYAQGIKDADAMLGKLKAYIDSRERPTVLVWFGDHLPTLGQAYTPYDTLGYFDSSDCSTENRMKMYSTPFLVYANRDINQGLFTSKSDNCISDSYLLECVAASTGFTQTPFMQYLGNTIKTLPAYNVVLNMDSNLTEEQSKIVNNWKLLTYDRIFGNKYSVSD